MVPISLCQVCDINSQTRREGPDPKQVQLITMLNQDYRQIYSGVHSFVPGRCAKEGIVNFLPLYFQFLFLKEKKLGGGVVNFFWRVEKSLFKIVKTFPGFIRNLYIKREPYRFNDKYYGQKSFLLYILSSTSYYIK